MVSADSIRRLRRWWSGIAILLVAGTFAEAAFAGAVLSGFGWARMAHTFNAGLLIALTLAAGTIAAVTLRRVPQGKKLGFSLLALAAVLLVQAAVGGSSAAGTDLLWIHVPLGAALVGFAARTMAGARSLGRS